MLKSQKTLDKSRLGRLLVNRGYISEVQLQTALEQQRAAGGRLGEALISQGIITEKELNRTLKHQERYRFAAAFVAMVVTPLQPMVAMASGGAAASIPKTPVAESQSLAFSKFSRMQALDDSELGSVSAQGLTEDFQKISERIADFKNGDGSELDKEDISQVEMLAHLALPVSNFIESDTKIEGVEYNGNKPIMALNDDGSVEMGFPTHIDRITMENVNFKGATTPAIGNIYISDVNFHPDMSVTIRVR